MRSSIRAALAGRQAAAIQAAVQLPPGVQLRPARPADRATFIEGILQEKLNPLSVDPACFTVAERTPLDGSSNSSVVVGFGQIKPLGGEAMELSTVIVTKSERGKGVGSALVSSLVAQAGDTPLYLTTLTSRADMYKRCGFKEVAQSQVPPFLLFEYLVGLVVAWLVTRERLVLMRLTSSTTAQQQQQQEPEIRQG